MLFQCIFVKVPMVKLNVASNLLCSCLFLLLKYPVIIPSLLKVSCKTWFMRFAIYAHKNVLPINIMRNLFGFNRFRIFVAEKYLYLCILISTPCIFMAYYVLSLRLLTISTNLHLIINLIRFPPCRFNNSFVLIPTGEANQSIWLYLNKIFAIFLSL